MYHIIGTSGHVDHGKTALIEALTGINADRLPEEQSRGMTIDLGFAHFEDPQGRPVGVIDVPGHERFLRNMVAGAWSLSCAVLVVAANEGWMQQTEDHARVLRALGIEPVVCALNKVDLVEPELLPEITEELQGHLERIFPGEVAILPVSAASGEGVEALRCHLLEILQGLPEREAGGRAYIHIDRVFSVKGAGTVVTGSLAGGEIREGDELTILPRGKTCRIRGIQSYYRPVKTAAPVSRVACNLQGIGKEELSRGCVAALDPDAFWTDREFIIRWEAMAGEHSGGDGELIRNHMELELASGTDHRIGTIHFLRSKGFARIVLQEPVSVLPYASLLFIRRGGHHILGKGIFFHPGATDRNFKIRLASLLENFPVLKQLEQGVLLHFMMNDWALPGSPAEVEGLETFIREQQLEVRSSGGTVVLQERWNRELAVLKQLAFATGGLTRADWLSRPGLPREIRKALLAELLGPGGFVQQGQVIISSIQLREETEISPEARRILALLEGEEVRGVQLKEIRVSGAKRELRNLVRTGRVLSLEDEIFYSKGRFEGLARQILRGRGAGSSFTIPEAKERTGLSRRYIIPVLNKMEEQGLLRREGDRRIVL